MHLFPQHELPTLLQYAPPPLILQVQKTCDTCGGTGVNYRQQKVQETLEVHIPKGAPDGEAPQYSTPMQRQPSSQLSWVCLCLSR